MHRVKIFRPATRDWVWAWVPKWYRPDPPPPGHHVSER